MSRATIGFWSSPSGWSPLAFFEQRFQFRHRLKLARPSSRMLDLDQPLEVDAATGSPKQGDRDRVRKQIFVPPSLGNLSE
jgi:hypothetical protein